MSFGHALNVRMFGAKGDWNEATLTGTDDTLAIQAAIDASIALSCHVVVPPGIYKITQRPGQIYALDLKTNTHLVGIGLPTIRIADDYYDVVSTDYNALEAQGGVHNVCIEGLRFQGNNEPYDRAKVTGYNGAIVFTGHLRSNGTTSANYDIEIRDCQFDSLFGFSVHGIYEQNYNIKILRNRVRKCSNTFNVNASGQIVDNYVEDAPGIEHYSGNILVANNVFRRVTNVGIAVGGGGSYLDGFVCKGNIIHGSIRSGVSASAIGIAVGSGIRNVVLQGNAVFDCDDIGLLIHNAGLDPNVWPVARDVIVDGMRIRGCGSNGMYMTDQVGPITIQNTTVTGCASAALNVRGVSALFLGRGNYWRTDHSNATDWLLQEFALNVIADESNDFRRKTSDFDPAAIVTWV